MASQNDTNDWETSSAKEGLVSIPSTRLWFYAQGPARQKGQPVVIFEAGQGATGSWWAAVARLLAPHIRTYAYDRAGLGRSEPSTATRTAANMATELVELLKAVKVEPPYVVVTHSYGGVISREFFAALPTDSIVGMVFVDANQENTHADLRSPVSSVQAVFAKVDFMGVTGLKERHQLTSDEMARVEEDGMSPTTAEASKGESDNLLESAKVLKSKNQLETTALGPYPVTVIRGDCPSEVKQVLDVATVGEHGTVEEIENVKAWHGRYEAMDLDLQKAILKLSSNSRFVQAEHSGHSVQWTEPQLVADEILAIVKTASQS